MSAKLKPWESGSEYHWMNLAGFSNEPAHPAHAHLYSLGRTALADTIKFAMQSLGWKRLWIATYNCPEVVAAIESTGIETAFYFDTPFDPVSVPPNIAPGDAIFIVNFFGIKSKEDYAGMYQLGIPVIEDHTHDPWSPWALESKADYCVASYRKVLPIPDGGAVWSNNGSPLAPDPLENDRSAAEISEKLGAMLLKTNYLAGAPCRKDSYIALFDQAKKKVTQLSLQGDNEGKAISAVSREMLKIFPWKLWRKQRSKNHSYMLQKLSCSPDLRILEPHGTDSCPFILTMLLSSRLERDQVKQQLIERSVYPAVIWPLERISCAWSEERSFEISEKILAVQCDGRYSLADMDRVAATLFECINL